MDTLYRVHLTKSYIAIGLAKEITAESRTTLRGKNSSYDLHILTWLSRKLKLIQPRSLQKVMISERTGYIYTGSTKIDIHVASTVSVAKL